MSGQDRSTRLPGDPALWIFIAADMLSFSVFFVTYGWYQAHQDALFNNGQAFLNTSIGFVNLIVLLTSSLAIASAIRAFEHEMPQRARPLILIALACGAAFIVLKVVEYSHQIKLGHTVGTNDFFMFYYMLTGMHLVHVLIGMGGLIFMLGLTRSPAPENPNRLRHAESAASYWHMVDLLWVVLFPLIYLS